MISAFLAAIQYFPTIYLDFIVQIVVCYACYSTLVLVNIYLHIFKINRNSNSPALMFLAPHVPVLFLKKREKLTKIFNVYLNNMYVFK